MDKKKLEVNILLASLKENERQHTSTPRSTVSSAFGKAV